MNKEELRIGNLVSDEFMLSCSFSVTTIGKTYCTYKGAQEFKSTCDKLKPIPLTEDWLIKKSGFRKDGILYENGEFAVKAWEVGGEIEWIIFWGNQVILKKKNYKVHQLQNLYFCLTGEELPIKQ